jgi:uncharacterized coiled-coil DUF342 family protein
VEQEARGEGRSVRQSKKEQDAKTKRLEDVVQELQEEMEKLAARKQEHRDDISEVEAKIKKILKEVAAVEEERAGSTKEPEESVSWLAIAEEGASAGTQSSTRYRKVQHIP